MTAEQRAIVDKYVRLFEQKWKIRPAPSKPDPDGYTYDRVIGGRE